MSHIPGGRGPSPNFIRSFLYPGSQADYLKTSPLNLLMSNNFLSKTIVFEFPKSTILLNGWLGPSRDVHSPCLPFDPTDFFRPAQQLLLALASLLILHGGTTVKPLVTRVIESSRVTRSSAIGKKIHRAKTTALEVQPAIKSWPKIVQASYLCSDSHGLTSREGGFITPSL